MNYEDIKNECMSYAEELNKALLKWFNRLLINHNVNVNVNVDVNIMKWNEFNNFPDWKKILMIFLNKQLKS